MDAVIARPPRKMDHPVLVAEHDDRRDALEMHQLVRSPRNRIPVLVTRTATTGLGEPVANAAADVITCERTKFGPRFAAEDFETLVYPVGEGYVQTTLAYWKHILDARQPLYATAETPTPEVTG